MAHRTRRYLLQMTIRVVCFLGAVVVDHWTRWLLLAGAVVLPYVAVVLANVGQERGQDPGTFVVARTLPRAPERPGPADGPPEDDHPMTSRGAQQ
ncbi:MAG: DUF3099 domain-containing protein [Cellulomonadaceae bacterium]|nr:DUF3099 domain-containing protein [Cellulomonadaceae bacterium]